MQIEEKDKELVNTTYELDVIERGLITAGMIHKVRTSVDLDKCMNLVNSLAKQHADKLPDAITPASLAAKRCNKHAEKVLAQLEKLEKQKEP